MSFKRNDGVRGGAWGERVFQVQAKEPRWRDVEGGAACLPSREFWGIPNRRREEEDLETQLTEGLECQTTTFILVLMNQ